ncbi:hypothetical protein B0H12DRAFT_1172482 [Mycena haematopus]|nr:hypothetical protein B0H12DRAFT_1172482 [Mycena haematopus]
MKKRCAIRCPAQKRGDTPTPRKEQEKRKVGAQYAPKSQRSAIRPRKEGKQKMRNKCQARHATRPRPAQKKRAEAIPREESRN